MLQVQDIHTFYGRSHILQGVSLNVATGEAVALLGRNGVGKTTTIKSIIGFTPPRDGRIFLQEMDVTGRPSHEIARLGVGLVPQGRDIFPTLTVKENITLAARNAANGGWTYERILETFPFLAKRLGSKGGKLSGGEQQMLAIGRALMTNPQLLLLDEPSEGLAPLIVAEISRIIRQLRDEGLSILIVEQNLAMALEMADRVYVMNKGQIVFNGTPTELQTAETVMHQYLGV
ncbi:MAG: ABC transporter ATP-binding protein [Chloroflexi bacterium]|nr:ABC transporter ATP-binding protein [Chloroflexota bacterium]